MSVTILGQWFCWRRAGRITLLFKRVCVVAVMNSTVWGGCGSYPLPEVLSFQPFPLPPHLPSRLGPAPGCSVCTQDCGQQHLGSPLYRGPGTCAVCQPQKPSCSYLVADGCVSVRLFTRTTQGWDRSCTRTQLFPPGPPVGSEQTRQAGGAGGTA